NLARPQRVCRAGLPGGGAGAQLPQGHGPRRIRGCDGPGSAYRLRNAGASGRHSSGFGKRPRGGVCVAPGPGAVAGRRDHRQPVGTGRQGRAAGGTALEKGGGGMSRIRQAFAAAARAGRPAVMPYVTAGDPNLTVTAELLPALVEAGADIVELGVPYSDPLADGPTNQRAAQRALLAGTTVAGVLDTVAQARDRGLAIPIVLLVYYNCIYRHGEAAFVQRAAAAGVDGLIVPDLPPEEAASLRAVAQAAGLDLVPLAAPTSTDDRLALIGRVASGFIYCVSVTGVTGARSTLPPELAAFLQRVRQATGGRVPLAVGFGISAPEHVREVGRLADGVIIGSALVERLEKAASPQAAVEEAAALVRAMRRAAEEARVSMTA